MRQILTDAFKFNAYMKLKLDSLYARGETTINLLSNLLKSYFESSDKTFTTFFNRRLDEYDKGCDVNPQSLMVMAASKFKPLKDQGNWNAPSEEQ